LWGFADRASLRLLDMTRNAPYFWAFSLGAWSASYGLVGLRQIMYGISKRSAGSVVQTIEKSSLAVVAFTAIAVCRAKPHTGKRIQGNKDSCIAPKYREPFEFPLEKAKNDTHSPKGL
jgi:hypothetical protein